MEPLDDLASVSATQGIDVILCGGHAVNAYQVIRKTGDVDLVVRERDLRRWRDQLVALGYSVFHEDPAFLQLSPPTAAGWPPDLPAQSDSALAECVLPPGAPGALEDLMHG